MCAHSMRRAHVSGEWAALVSQATAAGYLELTKAAQNASTAEEDVIVFSRKLKPRYRVTAKAERFLSERSSTSSWNPLAG